MPTAQGYYTSKYAPEARFNTYDEALAFNREREAEGRVSNLSKLRTNYPSAGQLATWDDAKVQEAIDVMDQQQKYVRGRRQEMEAPLLTGGQLAGTDAAKGYQQQRAAQVLGNVDTGDPRSQQVYKALLDAGMQDEAVRYLQKAGPGGEQATRDEVERALSVLEQDPNIGRESTTYRLLEAVKTNPQLASKMLADAGDINKAYSLIGRDVNKEEALRSPRAQTSAATSAASTGSRIQTEAELAPVSAGTEATVASARERAKMETEREVGRPLGGVEARKLGSVKASLDQMDELITGISDASKPTGPFKQLAALNPYDVKAQGTKQLIKATKQLVGKALEEGVLRKEDEEKYDAILPKLGDPYDVAIAKAKQIKAMLNVSYKADRDALEQAGYNVSSFPASYETETSGGGIDFDNLWGAE